MRKSSSLALVAGSLIFLVLGMLFAQLGPSLAELAAATGSTLAAVGAIYTAFFLGALPTQIVAGPVSDRTGSRPVLMLGLVLAAIGMLGVSFSRSLPVLLGCGFFGGLGFGCLTIGTNLLIARTYTTHNVAALNLVNVFYGAGAVAGPAAASLALRGWHTSIPVIWLGAGALVLLLPVLYALPAEGTPASGVWPAADAGAGRPRALRSPLLWAMAAVLLLYVGLESSAAAWIATYLQATAALPLETAALVVSAYWLALTGGRVVNTGLGMRLTADRVLLVSLGGALLGACVLVASTGSLVWTIAGVLVMGFSFGAVFPTGFAIVTGSFPTHAGQAASVVQAGGSFGGMSLPALMGLILTGTGPSASMRFIAVGVFAMLLFYLWARRLLVGTEARRGRPRIGPRMRG